MCRLASHMRTISISRSRKSDPTRPCGLSYSALKSCSLFIFVDWLCACVRACGLRRFVCGHSSRPLSTGNKFACGLPAWSGRCPLTVRTEVPQQASSSIHWTAITAASTAPPPPPPAANRFVACGGSEGNSRTRGTSMPDGVGMSNQTAKRSLGTITAVLVTHALLCTA